MGINTGDEMNNLKCYALFNRVWGEFGQGVESLDLAGVILAYSEDSARWAAKIAKIEFDEIRELSTVDKDSTIFKA